MKNSEIRAPMDGLLTRHSDDRRRTGRQKATNSSLSRRNQNYVRGEVNEEDVGEVKPGMKAMVQLYAYRTQGISRPAFLPFNRRPIRKRSVTRLSFKWKNRPTT